MNLTVTEKLRAGLMELSECCPVEHGNPELCPLFELRRMSPTKRAQWVNDLTENELAYLTAYHHVCHKVKVGTLLARRDH